MMNRPAGGPAPRMLEPRPRTPARPRGARVAALASAVLAVWLGSKVALADVAPAPKTTAEATVAVGDDSPPRRPLPD